MTGKSERFAKTLSDVTRGEGEEEEADLRPLEMDAEICKKVVAIGDAQKLDVERPLLADELDGDAHALFRVLDNSAQVVE